MVLIEYPLHLNLPYEVHRIGFHSRVSIYDRWHFKHLFENCMHSELITENNCEESLLQTITDNFNVKYL